MTEVTELAAAEIDEFLRRMNYGHLACAHNGEPYVVPIHFVYQAPFIFIYTTEGLKTQIIDANPRVCVQTENIVDNGKWESVVVNGEAERIIDPAERELALKLVREINPDLSPAVSIRWVDNWIRQNHEVVYRIRVTRLSGRSAHHVNVTAAFAQPVGKKLN